MDKKKIKLHLNWAKEFGTFSFLKYVFATILKKDNHLDRLYEKKLEKYALRALEQIDENGIVAEPANNTIWTFWWSGEDTMPVLAKAGLESFRKNAIGYNVVLLTKDNIPEYICIPEKYYDLLNNGQISIIHFCDILRMRILREKGGVWMDSTILLEREIPKDISTYKLYSSKRIPNGFSNVAQGRWAGNFLCTNEINNRMLSALVELYDLYFIEHKMVITYFMFDYCLDIFCRHDKSIKEMFDSIPYNNQDIKELNRLLFEKYDESNWNNMVNNTFVYKMNWRNYNEEKAKLEGTYFAKIVRPYINNIREM